MQKKLTAQQRTELLDHVSACQSAYHIDSTPGHRFGGLPSNLPENRDALVDFVEELLRAAQVPDGYVLVPIKPTPAMLVALWDHRDSMAGQSENRIAKAGYARMLTAVQAQPVGTCMAALWAIHIPGPGDVLAAPSKAAAEHMAAKHNDSMTSYLDAHPGLLDRLDMTLESIKAQVIEWTHGAAEHAEELADFDYTEWGINAAQEGGTK